MIVNIITVRVKYFTFENFETADYFLNFCAFLENLKKGCIVKFFDDSLGITFNFIKLKDLPKIFTKVSTETRINETRALQ